MPRHHRPARHPVTIVRRGTPTAPGAVRVYCGNPSPLGNPHARRGLKMTERHRVCDLYEDEFGSTSQLAAVAVIADIAQRQPVELECWCWPKRCHCETIKRWLEILY